jgi:hypothetical protein
LTSNKISNQGNEIQILKRYSGFPFFFDIFSFHESESGSTVGKSTSSQKLNKITVCFQSADGALKRFAGILSFPDPFQRPLGLIEQLQYAA